MSKQCKNEHEKIRVAFITKQSEEGRIFTTVTECSNIYHQNKDNFPIKKGNSILKVNNRIHL